MSDEDQIRALIGDHFEALGWDEGGLPDWDRFSEDFLDGAVLYPSARPAIQWRLADFVERMNGVATGGNLRRFEEHTRGMDIRIFGNIAVVMAASWMLENGTEENHDISAYLLVKTDGVWKIAAHAWDKAHAGNPVPDDLAGS